MGDFPRRMVYTVTMKRKVYTITFMDGNFAKLREVAASVCAVSAYGNRKGEPSPATLMLEIARGSVECYTLDCVPPE